MTTAHRPTFKSAVGGSEQGGNKILVTTRSYSAKDLPAYLVLKERKKGQGTQDELQEKDFKEELLNREQEGKKKKDLQQLGVSDTSLAIQKDMEQQERDIQEPRIIKKVKQEKFAQDADNEAFMQSSQEEKSENDEKNSSEDDEEDLMKEFQKIKSQRENDEREKVKDQQEEYEKNREEEILKGNPLVAGDDYSLKKKWYEDTIFRNQAKLEERQNQRFINDAVRSDFHRKFLNKYIMM